MSYLLLSDVLIIGVDINVHIEKDENNKFYLYNSLNRNKYLAKFTLENRFVCLNTELQKKKGNLLTYDYSNNSKVQLVHLFINKRINRAMKYEVYFSLKEVSSDVRIVSAKICLTLHRDKKQIGKTLRYDRGHLPIRIYAIII